MDAPRSDAPLAAALLVHAGLAVALYAALAPARGWPGGWRLGTWIESPSAQHARTLARHAAERLDAFAAENESARGGAVVFLGSSTIERLPLADLFRSRPCLNRGIAGAGAADVERWLDRLLPRARPGAIVVYAGAADWHELHADADEVVRRVRSLLEALVRRWPPAEALLPGAVHRSPGVPLTLIGILPARGSSAADAQRLADLDRRLASLAGELRASFVPVLRPPLSSPEGKLAEDVSADALHLDARGERVLARWIVADGGAAGRILAP